MQERTNRNIRALEEAIKILTAQFYAHEETIRGLINTVGNMNEKILSLEKLIQTQKVASFGHGPTERLPQ